MAEQIASVLNMNNTGRLPSIAMIHIGVAVRLTNTVGPPEAVTDSTGVIIGIDLHPDEPGVAAEHALGNEGVRIVKQLPTVISKLDDVKTEFLPPAPCELHAINGACRDCDCCVFRVGCIAVGPHTAASM